MEGKKRLARIWLSTHRHSVHCTRVGPAWHYTTIHCTTLHYTTLRYTTLLCLELGQAHYKPIFIIFYYYSTILLPPCGKSFDCNKNTAKRKILQIYINARLLWVSQVGRKALTDHECDGSVSSPVDTAGNTELLPFLSVKLRTLLGAQSCSGFSM